MDKKEVVAEYKFEDENAAGLEGFIGSAFADPGIISDDEITVYVYDDQGFSAAKATFVRETLTDGSTVVNLVFHFDRSLTLGR